MSLSPLYALGQLDWSDWTNEKNGNEIYFNTIFNFSIYNNKYSTNCVTSTSDVEQTNKVDTPKNVNIVNS